MSKYSKNYDESYPQAILPINACNHSPKDKHTAESLCQKCKASVKIKLGLNNKSCDSYKSENSNGAVESSDANRGKGKSGDNNGMIKVGAGSFFNIGERCERLAREMAKKAVHFVTKYSSQHVCR